MNKILVVDDEPEFLKNMEEFLEVDYEVKAFTDPKEALDWAQNKTDIDLVISDYRMPGMDGIKFLTAMKGTHPNTTRIIVSAFSDQEELIAAINEAEIYRFIHKPFNIGMLMHAIRQGIIERQLLMENQYLTDRVAHLSEENRRLQEKLKAK